MRYTPTLQKGAMNAAASRFRLRRAHGVMTVQKFTWGLWNLLPVAQFQGARRSASVAHDFGDVGITSRRGQFHSLPSRGFSSYPTR